MNVTEILATTRLAGLTRELDDIRQLPQDLLGLRRVQPQDAEDGEIMARVTGRAVAADIIADGAKAVIKPSNPVRLTQTHIPNIKIGRAITQEKMTLLSRIIQGGGLPGDLQSFDSYVADEVQFNYVGVQEREESMVWGMLIDNYTYNQNGVQITNLSWGMPTDLKVTPGNLWSVPAAADGIADILNLRQVGREKYGIDYNRVTMSTTAFNYLVVQDAFKNYSKGIIGQAGVLPPISNSGIMRDIVMRILDMDVEIYDAQFDNVAADGTRTSVRYLPVNKVVLTRTQDDGDRRAFDWANGTVSESIVASVLKNDSQIIGAFAGAQRGIVAYAEGSMNPPVIELWSVAKGFPRKHKETASAVITSH